MVHARRNEDPILLPWERQAELPGIGRGEAGAISGAAGAVVLAALQEGDAGRGDCAFVVEGVGVARVLQGLLPVACRVAVGLGSAVEGAAVVAGLVGVDVAIAAAGLVGGVAQRALCGAIAVRIAVVPSIITLLGAVAADVRVAAAAVLFVLAVCGAVAIWCAVQAAVVALFWIFGDAVAAAAIDPGAVGVAPAPGLAVVGAVVALLIVVENAVTAVAITLVTRMMDGSVATVKKRAAILVDLEYRRTCRQEDGKRVIEWFGLSTRWLRDMV
ncbi:hypothetical protein FGG08_004862 [Glutinoglossum americanum]|uniref:Uncharacterized protein n=1 Tax=Glutinoglossum americanum TaxID=1670608 RepID=A0A9P8L3G4_9PEZI|nr:hypothetical protein FGG08_004862 [Glutinoglossum americanum]